MTHPGCTQLMAEAHTIELQDCAAKARAGHELRGSVAALVGATPIAVLIRFAGAQDAAALRRLAHMDSAPELTLPALVAEVDGELRAALSLNDSRLIADPFHWTLALAELLRTRARQLGDRREAGLRAALRHPRRTARAIRSAVTSLA
jgi:hypothetical protein